MLIKMIETEVLVVGEGSAGLTAAWIAHRHIKRSSRHAFRFNFVDQVPASRLNREDAGVAQSPCSGEQAQRRVGK